jgi:hypothetical protein
MLNPSSRLLAIALCLGLSAAASWASPLPRIAARMARPAAEFYDRLTRERFVPLGSSYIKYKDHHEVFDIGVYDAPAAESALAQMQRYGYNVVRVFLDPVRIASPGDARELSAGYMANVLDFLARARSHSIYVILVAGSFPSNGYYDSFLPSPRPSDLEEPNVRFLSPAYFEAKAAYLSQLVAQIKQADPDLLTTVFSYEVENELYLTNSRKPFDQGAGTVQTAAGVCDLASATSRQACMDDNLVLWVNRMIVAIRSQDPEAMVAASVYPFRAVGKPGPNGLLPLGLPQAESSFPARPKDLLERTGLSYIDFHSSPLKGGYALPRDLDSSEFSAMDKTRRPFLLGEVSAIKSVYDDDLTSAADAMRKHRANAFALGFAGCLFWAWEPYVDTRFWGLLEINGQLAPFKRGG